MKQNNRRAIRKYVDAHLAVVALETALHDGQERRRKTAVGLSEEQYDKAMALIEREADYLEAADA